MEVILTDDVVGVGDIGEKVSVRPGYARNFLIPKGLAFESQSRNAAIISHKMRQVDAKKKRMKVEASERAKAVSGLTVELALRVGSSGKVFGSISGRDIAEKLKELGYDLDRRRILLHDPIKKIGMHQVKVKLHSEVESTIKVNIIQVAATKEDEERAAEELRHSMEEVAKEKKVEQSEEESVDNNDK